jgi:uncharacterized paraquat-inducible protein A
MIDRITFACPACQARIKAPLQLVGHSRSCPRCGQTLSVPVQVPSEEPPVLVLDDSRPLPRRHSA